MSSFLAKSYANAMVNRRVVVDISYLSELSPDEALEQVQRFAAGKDIPRRDKKFEFNMLTAQVLSGFQELKKIASRVSYHDKAAIDDMSMRTEMLRQMLIEVLGDRFTGVQTLQHTIDDVMSLDEADVDFVQKRIDRTIEQSQHPQWKKVLQDHGFHPTKFLNQVLAYDANEGIGGNKVLSYHFVTAAAFGVSPQKLLDSTLRMPRTHQYLSHWTGLDLPMIQACITHHPLLDEETAAARVVHDRRRANTALLTGNKPGNFLN